MNASVTLLDIDNNNTRVARGRETLMTVGTARPGKPSVRSSCVGTAFEMTGVAFTGQEPQRLTKRYPPLLCRSHLLLSLTPSTCWLLLRIWVTFVEIRESDGETMSP